MIDEKETETMAAQNKMATIAFRIETELKERLIEEAKKDRRNLSQYIQILIVNHLDNSEAKAKNQGETLRSL